MTISSITLKKNLLSFNVNTKKQLNSGIIKYLFFLKQANLLSADFSHGEYGYGLYFSKHPSKAAQFSAVSIEKCLVYKWFGLVLNGMDWYQFKIFF